MKNVKKAKKVKQRAVRKEAGKIKTKSKGKHKPRYKSTSYAKNFDALTKMYQCNEYEYDSRGW